MKFKDYVKNTILCINQYINGNILKNKNISIISNNCWGGYMCQYSGIQYNSPFVGLFFYAGDYIKLLQNISVIYKPFSFIEREDSKYATILEKKDYPIGYWPEEDIEIHFLHYKSRQECVEKWNRRLQRLNMNNLIVKFCDRDLCTEEMIKTFDTLPFKIKVCFTTKEYPSLSSVIWLKEQSYLSEVNYCWLISDKYWSFVEVANRLLNINTTKAEKILLYFASLIRR